MQPVIKYRGGKSREIPEFKKFIPNDYNRYIEPFFGGGAVFFDIEPSKAILNDINKKLINFYCEVRNNYSALHMELSNLQELYESNQRNYLKIKSSSNATHVDNLNEELYYKLRDMYNGKIPCEYSEGTLYYFINKTSYSGMIRYNRNGEFNVPYGRYLHFNTHNITQAHSSLLKKAKLYNLDYSEIFDEMATPF